MQDTFLKPFEKEIQEFCERWKVIKLELFGSALRDDFSTASDLDFLVTFADDAKWSLFDFYEMQDELAEILNRKVDLFTRRSVEQSSNPYRKQEILKNAKSIYLS